MATFGWLDQKNRNLEPHCITKQQHHMKAALFSSFPKNGRTAWFDSQTENVEPLCITKQTAKQENGVHNTVPLKRIANVMRLIFVNEN